MKIYFAGSIRGGRDDKKLYEQIIKLLSNYGEVLTEHVGDEGLASFGETAVDNKFIHDRDLDWIASADVVVAEVTNPSLGVGYEVAKAETLKKPILCLYREQDGKRLSAMIAGSNEVKVNYYQRVEDLEEVFKDFFNEQ